MRIAPGFGLAAAPRVTIWVTTEADSPLHPRMTFHAVIRSAAGVTGDKAS
jgi:hypothetical protein